MIAPDTARAAAEALWRVMVELAEAGNDRVVDAQAGGASADAAEIASIAADLALTAQAAAVMARRNEPGSS